MMFFYLPYSFLFFARLALPLSLQSKEQTSFVVDVPGYTSTIGIGFFLHHLTTPYKTRSRRFDLLLDSCDTTSDFKCLLRLEDYEEHIRSKKSRDDVNIL